MDAKLTLEKAVTAAQQSETIKKQQPILQNGFHTEALNIEAVQSSK